MEIDTQEVKDYLAKIEGQIITLEKLRSELGVEKHTKSFDKIRNIMFQLVEQKVVRFLRKGEYKVVVQVSPVPVFSVPRERRPPVDLIFPRDFRSMEEMSFGKDVVIREGDMITIGGVKSKGKTHLCLNIVAENLDKNPVLMGNEYTVLVKGKHEPAPRFLHRLDKMSEWVNWTDEQGQDRFTLLPVSEDYAEHVVKDKLNVIDWINMDGDKQYDVGKVLGGIKANLGRGVGIAALQKGEGALNPRGGQFVRDFSDLELLLDGFGENEDDVLLTIKGAKEKRSPIVGKTFVYTISNGGTQILNFREVVKCHTCWGKRWRKAGNSSMPCEFCGQTGYIGKKIKVDIPF